MTELCRLAAKYGTDKTHYTPFYSLLLSGRRNSVKRVLEIGIGTPAAMKHVSGYEAGASLRMWAEYFPDAMIYGMDKDCEAVRETLEREALGSEGRVYTFLADQSRPWSYQHLLPEFGPFDLIVDDGSHLVEDQITTVENLLPHLAPDGLYIIEDVNAAEELIGRLKVPHSYVRVRGALEGRCVIINA